jgi:hypothetical protein
MPDDYQPAAPRTLLPGPTLDLHSGAPFGSGARAAFVSTTEGADVVAAPGGGGPVQRWTVSADKAFAPAEPLTAAGASVAAM